MGIQILKLILFYTILINLVLVSHQVKGENQPWWYPKATTPTYPNYDKVDLNTLWKEVSSTYPRYERTTILLQAIERTYPTLIKVYSIGESVQGRNMWVVNVRQNVTQERSLLQPPIKLVAGLHGDDALGKSLLLMLIVDLIKRFQVCDENVVKLLSSVDLHILPNANPDGFEIAKEGMCYSEAYYPIGSDNANGVDLTKDFPFGPGPSKNYYQKETENIMKFVEDGDFLLSASLEGSSYISGRPNPYGNLNWDAAIFKFLGKVYINNYKRVRSPWNFYELNYNHEPVGIGRSGMQNFNYFHNCFELAIKLNTCRFPGAFKLLNEFESNQESLYTFMEASKNSVRGTVLDENGSGVNQAEVVIDGVQVKTNNRGEYWRLVLPGHHPSVKVDGYEEVMRSIKDEPIIINFQKEKAGLLNYSLSKMKSIWNYVKAFGKQTGDKFLLNFL